ncbi:histone-lysine N-methyltransferase SETMAR [Trichonephila clavipes]|nr:histone-lysine N-methyltransferase SETMAR [Trichonephila clavipes]
MVATLKSNTTSNHDHWCKTSVANSLTASQQGVSKSVHYDVEGRSRIPQYTQCHSIPLSISNRVLTSNEKWVLYDTPKRSKHWLSPQDTIPLSARPPMHPRKIMLYVRWTCHQVVHYELLPTSQTVTADL